MGFKKQAIAALSVVSLLATSIGITDSTSANTQNNDYVQEELIQSDSPISVTCANIQNVINSIDTVGIVRLVEDCRVNLIIPSNKVIYLQLIDVQDDGTMPIEHNLMDDGGDTITIEEMGHLIYHGNGGSISNSTEGKSIINNKSNGNVSLTGEGEFRATNGAYTFTNSGAIYATFDGNYSGTRIRNNDPGIIWVTSGVFDNTEEVEPFIVNGCRLNGNSVVSALPEGKTHLDSYYNFINSFPSNGLRLPVGSSIDFQLDYWEYVFANNSGWFYTESPALNISLYPEGKYIFDVISAGEAEVSHEKGVLRLLVMK